MRALTLAPLAAMTVAGSALAQSATAEPPAPAAPRLRLERELGAGRAPAPADTPAYARALRIEGEMNEKITLTGDAEVRRGGAVLRGDRITYTVATDEAEIQGNARVYRDGVAFFGPSLRMRIDAKTGAMPEANFTYAPRNGRGRAKLLEFLGEGRTRLTEATFTTCRPDDEAWWVRANRLDLDGTDELAVARGARIYFQGVPIFASPYFQFPLGDRRRSGVLTPSFSINSRLGPEVTVPYYWNIAPNRDYTVTPRAMARRGVLLSNEFRYLEPTWRGTLAFDTIPDDADFGGSRERTSLQHEYSAPNGVVGGVNYNHVSDDRFFVDFGRNIVTSSTSVLPQEGYLGYNRTYWNTAVRVTKNQTLQDPLAPVTKPYERVPQLSLNSQAYDLAGFDAFGHVDATRFRHPTLETGSRFIANPGASFPLQAPGWFVVPRAQLHYTRYTLDEQTALPEPERRTERSLSRNVPIYSLDSGLVFERDATWFGDPAALTLEPRLYYAYIPYREQNALPNFDSALADFNFSQLFSENVFVGGDRIGQANQVTTALVGRVYDASGTERLRAAVGQRFYFSQQNVVLPGGVPRTDKASDVLFALAGVVQRRWITDIALQHSTLQNQIVRASVGVRYQPAPAKVLSLAYRYKLDELDQIDVAGQWPLSSRWYAVGRANYSRRDQRWVETLAGFEYKHDCWVVRFAAQRFVTGVDTRTTTAFVQLELTGLASIGSNPVETLRRNIPGYQLINPPPREPGRFDTYE
jgi:LPS-assembly protein